MKRVVITGLGVITPIGIGKSEFWKANKEGKSGIKYLPQFANMGFESKSFGYVEKFDPQDYGLSDDEIKRMDRVTQFGVVCSDEAVKDSGVIFDKEDVSRIGVNISTAIAGTRNMEREFIALTESGNDSIDPKKVSPYLYASSMSSTISNEVAARYGIKGVCCSLATGCTAGIDAIGFGFDEIGGGDYDIMICGASEAPLTPVTVSAFEAIHALSTNNDPPDMASRPFDKTRNGFVLSEASGVVIMEELEHALARHAHIYAEVKGYASVNNAIHMTGLQPDGKDLARAIELSIKQAGIDKKDIDYINAHGSGTKQNDINETGAFKRVFGDYARQIPISTTKSMTGHPLGAASAVEIIVCCLAIENSFVPPTINYRYKDEQCDLNYVPNKGFSKKLNAVLTDASGFSGLHAAMVLSK